jgi:hypothetical protein
MKESCLPADAVCRLPKTQCASAVGGAGMTSASASGPEICRFNTLVGCDWMNLLKCEKFWRIRQDRSMNLSCDLDKT